jgi:hypothetical protein
MSNNLEDTLFDGSKDNSQSENNSDLFNKAKDESNSKNNSSTDESQLNSIEGNESKKGLLAKIGFRSSRKEPDVPQEPNDYIEKKSHKKTVVAISLTFALISVAGAAGFYYIDHADSKKIEPNLVFPDMEDIQYDNEQVKVENNRDGAFDTNDSRYSNAMPSNLDDQPILKYKQPQTFISEGLENEYIRKIDELTLTVSSFSSFQNDVYTKMNTLNSQLNQIVSDISMLKNRFSSIPNAQEINSIKADISSTGQKIDFVKESISRLQDSVEKTSERSISNSTKLDLQNTNTQNELRRITASFEKTQEKVTKMDQEFSRKSFIANEPVRVTYSDGTSITSVPKSINPYSEPNAQQNDSMKVVKELTLKIIRGDGDSDQRSFIVEDDYKNSYSLKINSDLGSTLGRIKEFVNGTYESEPFLRTSENYIITTSDGKKG